MIVDVIYGRILPGRVCGCWSGVESAAVVGDCVVDDVEDNSGNDVDDDDGATDSVVTIGVSTAVRLDMGRRLGLVMATGITVIMQSVLEG